MKNVKFGYYQDFEELKGMTLIDMHTHSLFSDGRDKPEKCIKQAKKLGMNICLTDHNAIAGSKFACEKSFSLPSIEVTSKETYDFLLYFYKVKDLIDFHKKTVEGHRLVERSFLNYYRLRWSSQDLLEKAKEYNAVIVLPHPDALPPKNSGVFMDANRDLVKKIDAVEAINATMSEISNKKAISLAKKWKKGVTGCSDAHLSRFIGAGITAFESTSVEGVLEDLRKGKTIVVGNNLKFFNKLQSHMTVIRNNLKW